MPAARRSSDALTDGNKRANPILSYANALLGTDYKSNETTVRRRRILFAGFVSTLGEEGLPRRILMGRFSGIRATLGWRNENG